MNQVSISQSTNKILPNLSMEIGDIAVIKKAVHYGNNEYVGKNLMRVYGNFVLLEDPESTWNDQEYNFDVEIYPPGTVVEITKI